jgi:hypothetical protein
MLAVNWGVFKQLDAGFRRRICPMMLAWINFAAAEFKSLPVVHEFGSLRAFRIPLSSADITSGLMAEKSLPSRLKELGVEDQL